MAPIMKVKKLPVDIRGELHEKLRQENFSEYTSIAVWLMEKGYKVSRSALHRYAVENKDEIQNPNQDHQYHLAQLRLSALSVAVTVSPEKDIHALKHDAGNILKWALSGD